MSEKKISIVLRARNAMARGLSRAEQSLRKFGGGVAKFAKSAAKGFAYVSAAVAGVGAAMIVAAKKAEAFNQQIDQIRTISGLAAKDVSRQVRAMSAEFGLAKEELTKGLYDALSAGVPQENAFEFLKTAAQAARAGASSTAESVDLLTTTLNAFGIRAEHTEQVADMLFTTVRLGKTTISELAQNIAQVAPLASASGVALEDVLSATASLTKQGTPTAQAMTQIRAAILAMNRELGDGWTATMSLQEGMEAMNKKANGSANALRVLTGRVEGALAIMALTGDKAQAAAGDIDEMGKAAGAMGDAFAKVEQSNPLAKFGQALNNVVLTAGDAALTALAPTIERAAAAVSAFGQRIADWAGGEQFKAVQESVEGIINAMTSGSEGRGEAIGAIANLLMSALKDGGEFVGNYLLDLAPKIGTAIGNAMRDAAKGAVQKIGDADAVRKLMRDRGQITRTQEMFPNLAGFNEEQKAIYDQLMDGMAKVNEEAKKVEIGGGDGPSRTQDALARLKEIADQHRDTGEAAAAAREVERAASAAATEAFRAEQKAIADANAAKAAGLAAEKKAAEEKLALEKKLADDIKKLEDEKKQAQVKAAQDKVDAAKKEADKLAAIAGKRVKDFIDEAKEKKDADKAAAREAKQMAELEASLARGATLSKRQQARLDAFRQIQAAKDQMEGPEGAAQKLADAQKAMEELQGKQLRELGDIKHEIEKQTAELAMLKGLGELKGIHKDIADHNAKLDGLLTLA